MLTTGWLTHPERNIPMKLEATQLRDGRWAVRPEGQLGTCGYYPQPWTVVYVRATTAERAIAKAAARVKR